MKLSPLEVGVDVPWVTSWSSETLSGVIKCPTIRGLPAIDQVESPGLGKPQYSKNHIVRQRLSIVRMLCPMCGEPTAEGNRWTQVAKPIAAGALRVRGVAIPASVNDDQVVVDAGAIAPLHRRCAERSLRHCPHLRAAPDVRLIRFPKEWIVIPLLVDTDEVNGSRPQVIGFLQLCGLTQTVDRRWRNGRAAGPQDQRS